jgi:recombination protein RecT
VTNPTQAAAVAVRDNSPRAMVAEYRSDFATVLPTHLRADTFVRVAQGALKRGKKAEGDRAGRYELEVAAANNPGLFMAALLDAARLGLEPGTEQFYLTPRRNKGQLEILGIVGWQGYVELMYRAGAVASVVAEVVRERDDYQYKRGVDEVPVHEYPKFAGEKTRGKLIGVYAYARMTNGAVSRVIELGEEDIEQIKKSATGSDSRYSPWVTHTESMWLKSAVRQLAKWVPTSAERVGAPGPQPVRVEVERDDLPAPRLPAPAGGLDEQHVDYATGEIADAEIVEEPTADGWPPVTPAGGAQ